MFTPIYEVEGGLHMSICEKGGLLSNKKGEPHVCFGSIDGHVRVWRVHPNVVDVHSLDTKKVTVIA